MRRPVLQQSAHACGSLEKACSAEAGQGHQLDRHGQAAPGGRGHDTPKVGSLTLLSYFDSIDDLDALGRYLFWGFIVKGPLGQVTQRLRPFIARQEQLQQVEGTFVIAEERKGGRWQVVKPQPGRIPGTRLLERSLILERDDDSPPTLARVSGTLQGAVYEPVLMELRPDIPHAEYPEPRPDRTTMNGADALTWSMALGGEKRLPRK